MLQLLARIVAGGSALKAQREAYEGLRAIRHTALHGEAYVAYDKACSLTLTAIYDGAAAWGIKGFEVQP